RWCWWSPKPEPPAHAASETAQLIARTAPAIRQPRRTAEFIQVSPSAFAFSLAAPRDSLAGKIRSEVVRQHGKRPNRDDHDPSRPQPLVPSGGPEKADRPRGQHPPPP